MSNLTSTLDIKVIDGVTGPVKSVADALKKAEGQIKAIDSAMGAGNGSTSLENSWRLSGAVQQTLIAWRNRGGSMLRPSAPLAMPRTGPKRRHSKLRAGKIK